MAQAKPQILQNSASFRRMPKQARGQRRVAQILSHAEVLFAEVGFENATTNLIAERADVSIGSLYQFFSSKEAILEAMAEGYLETMLSTLAEIMSTLQERKLPDIIHDLLLAVISLQERRPYFLQCLISQSPSPVLAALVDRIVTALAGSVAQLLIQKGAKLAPDDLMLKSRICVETMGTLLPLVIYVHGDARVRASREIELIILRYLEPIMPQAESA